MEKSEIKSENSLENSEEDDDDDLFNSLIEMDESIELEPEEEVDSFLEKS